MKNNSDLKKISEACVIPLVAWRDEIDNFIQSHSIENKNELLDWFNLQGRAAFEEAQSNYYQDTVNNNLMRTGKSELPEFSQMSYEMQIKSGFKSLNKAFKNSYPSKNNLKDLTEDWIVEHRPIISTYWSFMCYLASYLNQNPGIIINEETIKKLKIAFFDKVENDLLRQIKIIANPQRFNQPVTNRNPSSPLLYKKPCIFKDDTDDDSELDNKLEY